MFKNKSIVGGHILKNKDPTNSYGSYGSLCYMWLMMWYIRMIMWIKNEIFCKLGALVKYSEVTL